jgi:hypothetical protein
VRFSLPLEIGIIFTEIVSYRGVVKEKKLVEESRRIYIKSSQRRFLDRWKLVMNLHPKVAEPLF